MNKFNQSSIWDSLIDIMPELGVMTRRTTEYVDPLAANSLYTLWRSGESKRGSKEYKQPVTFAKDDVDRMKNAGLVKVIGNDIQLTSKGEKVIRIMILGDDRSVFDNNEIIIDYNTALNKTRGIKTAKSVRKS